MIRAFKDEEIIARVESLPTFKGWKKGIYDVWLRSSADEFDKFDDKAFTFEVASDGATPRFVMSREGTTNAGSYGLKKFEDYNHLGCAVLKSNVIIYASHTKGLHHGKLAYSQAKGWPYFRDANRNNKAEELGREYNDIIGANIHRAGQNSTVIKNWSTACLVTAQLPKFQEFLDFMKSKGYPALNVAILKEWKVGEKSLASPKTIVDTQPKQTEDSSTNTNESKVESSVPDTVTTTEVVKSQVDEDTTSTVVTETSSSNDSATEVKKEVPSFKSMAQAGIAWLLALPAAIWAIFQGFFEKLDSVPSVNLIVLLGFVMGMSYLGYKIYSDSANRASNINVVNLQNAADKDKINTQLGN